MMKNSNDFILFTEADKVNVKEIDAQHLSFIGILNKMHHNAGGKSKSGFDKLLREFQDELKIHFDTEEKLMKENKFHGYFSHKLEHERVLEKTVEFSKTNSYRSELIIDFLESSKKWFFNHLDLSDRKLGEYLNSVGIY